VCVCVCVCVCVRVSIYDLLILEVKTGLWVPFVAVHRPAIFSVPGCGFLPL
jgi:hypothetical protein